jgi:hypothetical protein
MDEMTRSTPRRSLVARLKHRSRQEIIESCSGAKLENGANAGVFTVTPVKASLSSNVQIWSATVPGLFLKDGEDRSEIARFDDPSDPCPVTTLTAFLKQINRGELNSVDCGFLNSAFSGFVTGITPPGHISALIAAISKDVSTEFKYENRIPRRYDGDQTLPPGRYSTICSDATGNDFGTLTREMRFYFNPKAAEGYVEVFDSTVPEDSLRLRDLGVAISQEEPRVTIRYFPFATSSGKVFSTYYSIPLVVRQICVDRVLDLRRPDAANWLVRSVSSLTLSANAARYRAFAERPDLTEFSQIIWGLMDQAKGGGNLHKIIGLYLRQLGVAGLVFPSARGDATVEFTEGVPRKDSGWSFVDFQNAPATDIVVFFELRPNWPTALVNEGGDDNIPTSPAYAGQVNFSVEGYSKGEGHMSVTGLERRMRAYYLFGSASAAIRYRLRATDSDIQYLTNYVVSLDPESAVSLSSMILFSILGHPAAQNDLSNAVKNQLQGHPLSSLLTACCKPPPPSEEQAQALARFLGNAFSGGPKSIPEPAT